MARTKRQPPATPGGAFHHDLDLPVEYRRREHIAALAAMIEECRATGSHNAVSALTKQMAALSGLDTPLDPADALPPEPVSVIESLRQRLEAAREMRARASAAGTFGAAAALIKQEVELIAAIAEAERASAATVDDVSDAELVESIAADVQALPPTVRAAVLARLSAPVLRVVKASNG
jgi:superfamily I DNA/RNA helicase